MIRTLSQGISFICPRRLFHNRGNEKCRSLIRLDGMSMRWSILLRGRVNNSGLSLDLPSDIIRLVRSKILRAVATFTLLTCLVCPVMQMFDHWDHELRTGQDTEYTFMLATLCAGAVYALAKLIVTFAPGPTARRVIPDLPRADLPTFPSVQIAALSLLSESPPFSLRI